MFLHQIYCIFCIYSIFELTWSWSSLAAKFVGLWQQQRGGRARPDWAYEFPGRTGPESKFAGLVLPDRTESVLIFLNILPYKKK